MREFGGKGIQSDDYLGLEKHQRLLRKYVRNEANYFCFLKFAVCRTFLAIINFHFIMLFRTA